MTQRFISELADKRQKYLEGLDANEGDINLDIFEDFYPDKAHFVYEILQNAEDAEASEVSFQLSREGCLVEHNGKRLFDEADVRSITGIHNSTKKNRPDQIGKWGIGFKSVFVYTLTPEIHSGPFAFKIVRLIKPEPVSARQSGPKMTRFWLPFNNPKKRQDDAFNEVAAGFGDLSETALLFLSRVQSVSWKIEASKHVEVLRIEHSKEHIEVLKQENGSVASSAHFLRFTRPAEGLENQKLAIAFNLELLPNVTNVDSTLALNQQARVVPAVGQVAVFFTAKRETSGLKFHVHIPGIPTPDRANIKDIPENETFFSQLATLSVEALTELKGLGFLTRDFLEVLPNEKDDLGNSEDDRRFDKIRTSIVEAFNKQPLMPTFAKTHAPAKNLYQAKDSLKRLVSDKDLEFLIKGSIVAPRWSVNTDKEGTRIHRFMTGLALNEWGFSDFVDTIVDRAEEEYSEPDEDFMTWLSTKSPDWFQELYYKLIDEKDVEDEIHQLTTTRIIRLSDGSLSSAKNCYFSDEERLYTKMVPCVDPDVLEVGGSKQRKKFARKFLEEIGVGEIGEKELVQAILQKDYSLLRILQPFKKTEYLAHLKRFLKFAEDNPLSVSIFDDFWIFLGSDGSWHKARDIYIDSPFIETGMSEYFQIVGCPEGVTGLSEDYLLFKVEKEKVLRFAKALGAMSHIPILKVSCYQNPNFSSLNRNAGYKTTNGFDQDFRIEKFDSLVSRRSILISRLIWNSVQERSAADPDILRALYRRNIKHGFWTVVSQLVHQLRNFDWVPQGGTFSKPSASRADLLPEKFYFDSGCKWITSVEFGKEVSLLSERTKAAAEEATQKLLRKNAAVMELGIQLEDLDLLEKLKVISPEQLDRLLEECKKSQHTVELPEHEPRNPERRAARVGMLAADAPERMTEVRTRSVSVGREEVKAKSAQYLQQQYTVDGNVICQVCKKPMPFNLDDGIPYFEKVEFLPCLTKRHFQNYLALCPNHAAMFQHANSTKELMMDFFAEMNGSELELVLAQENNTVYFTKTHIADLKKVIEVESNDPNGDNELGEEP